MTNCLYCQHWALSDMKQINVDLGKQGFAPCKLSKAKASYTAAGWHCRAWEEAEAKVVQLRRKFMGA